MQGQLHSKVQVMQSYLSAQEPTTTHPASKPHSSSNTALTAAYPSSPTTDHVIASDAASKQYPDGSAQIPSRVYTTPPPSWGGEAPPRFSRVGASPMASYSNTGKAHTPTAAAAARNPGQLVQVKRNVWLPWAVVQQAGGDADLALHLAAQDKTPTGSHDSTDSSSPTAGKAWTPASTTSKPSHDSSFLPRQDLGQKENDSCSIGIKSSRGADHAAYAPWSYNSQQVNNDGITAGAHHPSQYDSSKMQSHFHSAMSLKADSAADCNDGLSKFDPTIQPPGLYSYPSQGMGGPQTTASKQGNGCGFRSPTASLPTMGSSNTFVSPQCVMDNNNSLFSYSIATPEQTVHSRPAPLFATPDTHPTQVWGAPHTHNPTTTFNPAAYYPELNPSANHLHMSMGQAYGMADFSGMHCSHTGAGGYLGRPWLEGKAHQVMSQYGANPEAHKLHSNRAAGIGSNTTDDGLSGDWPTHPHELDDLTCILLVLLQGCLCSPFH